MGEVFRNNQYANDLVKFADDLERLEVPNKFTRDTLDKIIEQTMEELSFQLTEFGQLMAEDEVGDLDFYDFLRTQARIVR